MREQVVFSVNDLVVSKRLSRENLRRVMVEIEERRRNGEDIILPRVGDMPLVALSFAISEGVYDGDQRGLASSELGRRLDMMEAR